MCNHASDVSPQWGMGGGEWQQCTLVGKSILSLTLFRIARAW